MEPGPGKPTIGTPTVVVGPTSDRFSRFFDCASQWGLSQQIRTVLLSIQALLSAPNPDDPLDNNVAEVWKNNEQEALKRAREFTESFAMKGGDKKE
jgi:ubiquitin-conjugating enzyme E2 N